MSWDAGDYAYGEAVTIVYTPPHITLVAISSFNFLFHLNTIAVAGYRY